MRSFLRNIDKFFGNALVFIFSLLKSSKNRNLKFDIILINKLWAIGDSVISLSLIRAIKDNFPKAQIEVLTTKNIKDIFKYNSTDKQICINSIIGFFTIILSIRKYDIVFDCEPYFNISALVAFMVGKRRVGFSNQYRSRLYSDVVEFRKDQHMVQNYLDMLRSLNIDCDTENLESIIIPEEERKTVLNFISTELKDIKTVGICPGISGSVKSRMWYEERFASLADKIIDELQMQVIFIDSPKNKHIVDAIRKMMNNDSISVLNKLNLKDNLFLISKCDMFISNDTGLMHVAAAQGCKTIGLFGPNTPVLWAPYGKQNISIYKTKLLPCIKNDEGVFEDCDRMNYMGVISVDDVYNAVKYLFSS